jgi:hypothetical protein
MFSHDSSVFVLFASILCEYLPFLHYWVLVKNIEKLYIQLVKTIVKIYMKCEWLNMHFMHIVLRFYFFFFYFYQKHIHTERITSCVLFVFPLLYKICSTIFDNNEDYHDTLRFLRIEISFVFKLQLNKKKLESTK